MSAGAPASLHARIPDPGRQYSENSLVLFLRVLSQARQFLRFGDPLHQQPANIRQQARQQLVPRAIRDREMKIQVRLNVRRRSPLSRAAPFGSTLRAAKSSGCTLCRKRRKLGLENQARLADIRQVFFSLQQTFGQNAVEQTARRLSDIGAVSSAHSDHSNESERFQRFAQCRTPDIQRGT